MTTVQTVCVDCGRDFALKLGPRGGDRPNVCPSCLEEREIERLRRLFAPLPRRQPTHRTTTRLCRRCGQPATSSRHWLCDRCRALSKRRTAPRKPQASRQARGYGAEHDRRRRQWKARVDAGGVCCGHCGGEIVPGSAWHLSHPGDDRSAAPVPWHVRCNTQYAAAVTRPRRNRQRKAGR